MIQKVYADLNGLVLILEPQSSTLDYDIEEAAPYINLGKWNVHLPIANSLIQRISMGGRLGGSSIHTNAMYIFLWKGNW